jgi:hypothetical protein
MKKVANLLLIIWAVLLVGCTTKGTNWDIEGYAPVVETTMDLTNLIGNENVQANNDSSLWLNVDANAYNFDLDTLTSFPSFEAPFSFIWTYPTINVAGGTTLPPFDTPIDLSSTGIDLREVKLKSGKLKLTLKSTNAQRLIFNYTIPTATKGGVTFSFTDTIAGLAPGQDTVYYFAEFDVADYIIVTTGPNNDELSTFSAKIIVSSIAGDPPMTVVQNSVIFSVVNKMENIVPYYGKGYLGQYDFSQSNVSSNIDVMKAFRSGLIDIEQLTVKLVVHNSIGADLRFKPIYLKATNTNSGVQLTLTHPGMGNTININRAFETGNSANPVNPVLYTYTFNSGNSNVESIVELLPDKIDFSADMKLNPYGNIGGFTDFYYTDYPAHVQLQIQAPLKFAINQLLFVDTIENPFTNLDIVDNVVDGEFVIRAENKFPIAFNLQLFMLDATGATTDSLLVNDLIQAAPVNALNRVVQPVTTELIATVDADKITHLKSAAHIRIKGLFNTVPASAGRLQMYSDYYLKLKLIADIKYHIVL